MPFADVTRPALGVSLLKAAAARAGFSARVEYCNIDFAERVGVDLYTRLADDFPSDLLLGEWVFARAVFGDAIPADADFVEDVLSASVPAATIEDLLRARDEVPAYLDACASRIAAYQPAIVGFTSTFHQTLASVGVAERLKTLPGAPIVAFGGANCEGEMGEQLLRSFQCIDIVSRGEADETFVDVLRERFHGGAPPSVGILTRERSTPGSASLEHLDTLPVPDYDEYFDRIASHDQIPRHIVLETARGCWWGERRHCTFCGLNGETMAFRSKSPQRARDEIVECCSRYGTTTISFVDNILDPAYIETLFPDLAATGLDLDMFFEVKANLHRDELETLRAGGVRHIQPGIESLSDDVLRLMRKGVTAFQNIQLLRWAAELDLTCSWNIICGFPNEPPEAYARMASLLPSLEHLPPPGSSARVRLDRFSPFHVDPAQHGFSRVRPARAYFYVYPFGRRDLGRLAYYFDYDYEDGRDVDSYYGTVAAAVQQWWERWTRNDGPGVLEARLDGDAFVVTDTREVAIAEHHVVSGLRATILALCDRTTSVAQLARSPHVDGSETEIAAAIESLVNDGLVARSGGQLVSLPLFRDRPAGHRLFSYEPDVRIDAKTLVAAPLLRLGRSA
jgi:ribosomal peptide maturation radical SAM protein 1